MSEPTGRPTDFGLAVEQPWDCVQTTSRLRRELLGYYAAGAALLGGAQGAEGAIIYRDFPDAVVDASSRPFELDLDRDALAEFSIAPEPWISGVCDAVASTPLKPPPGGYCASIGCGFEAVILGPLLGESQPL